MEHLLECFDPYIRGSSVALIHDDGCRQWSYNWCPARPIFDYLHRVGDLKGKPVVVIVSGGGMTEQAMRVLQSRVVKAGGTIRDAVEIWTSRPNEERHGLSDPEAIGRRAGTRLTLAPQRNTA